MKGKGTKPNTDFEFSLTTSPLSGRMFDHYELKQTDIIALIWMIKSSPRAAIARLDDLMTRLAPHTPPTRGSIK